MTINQARELIDTNSSIIENKQDTKFTKTTIFLLPMFGYHVLNLPKNFINAYLNDLDNPYILIVQNPVFLLFADSNEKDWKLCQKVLNNHDNFYAKYYAGYDTKKEIDLIMYVFSVPGKFVGDYHLFLQGKYSQFSREFVEIYPKNIIDRNNTIIPIPSYLAISKDQMYRKHLEYSLDCFIEDESELWSIPDERELFNNIQKSLY